ncbi:hypothetical protein SDC9_150604 [bioreactor metagenome]|uniref:Uncharacterized protein n=1 Tax=bioreactor metagenome TaxID=1076179 RepID=A0A645EMY2_9ZZZZ
MQREEFKHGVCPGARDDYVARGEHVGKLGGEVLKALIAFLAHRRVGFARAADVRHVKALKYKSERRFERFVHGHRARRAAHHEHDWFGAIKTAQFKAFFARAVQKLIAYGRTSIDALIFFDVLERFVERDADF